ncbi:MAG: dUTP diphosphatase [Treponema sp.]|nr:dUTP diphosphatase [Treponema sp.]
MKVKVKLFEGGVMPEKMHIDDAAFDCYARLDEDVEIEVGTRTKIPLGFALELPKGWEAVIRPRSGLTLKCIDNGIGTIDANFRGEVCAVVINNNFHAPNVVNNEYKGLLQQERFIVHNGDRICQMVIKKLDEVELVEAEELTETERGEDGFGSSGIR